MCLDREKDTTTSARENVGTRGAAHTPGGLHQQVPFGTPPTRGAGKDTWGVRDQVLAQERLQQQSLIGA